ncbi:PucR family transcriptional regulator [Kitasatospora sp. NPDC057542]|uniref:PucR family transcriptional regulator n=1 Tax=Streptomycetaceae TaxID=2062 RepID=UPI001CCBD83B|nr:helix-turn-helix domain-containing protein [Streptomyces sp. LS1784]
MTEQRRRAPVGSAALRELIEELAESLRRSVALAGPSVRGICSSRHFDDADPARVHSLLQGRASSEAVRHVLDQGATRWSRPGFIEGRDDLGLHSRYCVPLRQRGHFLGLLMVIAPDGSLGPEEAEAIARATPAIAGQLYADHVLADAEKTREQELLLSLLGASPTARAESRNQLLDDALLPDAPHAVVSLVQVACSPVSPGQAATALRGALEGFRRTRSAHGAFAVTSNRAVLLQLADRPLTPEALREQSRHIMEVLGTRLDASAAPPVIGIGGHQTGLADARTSYEQALVAVRAARRIPGLKGIGSWEELGELAVLLQLPDRALNESLLPKPLRALLESSGGHRLEATLRCFLDQAGSTSRTAEALRIHRTSLHYRLRQIQEITGVDLDNGADRITLHMGLRIRELLVSLGASGDDGRRQAQAAAPGDDLAGRTPGADPQGRRGASVPPGQQVPPQRTRARRDQAGRSVTAGDHSRVEAA